MAIDTKDETENAYKETEDKTTSKSDKGQVNEVKKQKLLQIRGAISIYIIKIIVLLAIATIVTFTAPDTTALLLGALTFFATVVLDMAVLAKDNPVSDIWWICLAQWIISVIFLFVAVGDLLLILLYDNISLDAEAFFVISVPICMYIMGIFGSIIEIYYNIPYDD